MLCRLLGEYVSLLVIGFLFALFIMSSRSGSFLMISF